MSDLLPVFEFSNKFLRIENLEEAFEFAKSHYALESFCLPYHEPLKLEFYPGSGLKHYPDTGYEWDQEPYIEVFLGEELIAKIEQDINDMKDCDFDDVLIHCMDNHKFRALVCKLYAEMVEESEG